ncbi:hypothetical protein RQP46_001179 [Phenoliferia psychrophenolica]
MEWSRRKRWLLTILASVIAFTATFASSLPSGGSAQIKADFHASEFSNTLVISVFVLGYAVGPLFWAPLSEVFGRRPVFIGTFSAYTLLIIPCALAPNIGTLIAVRFLGGTFAACSLTNSGGSIGDLWIPLERNRPFATFGITPALGPLIAPVVSGFLAQHQGFRVTFWLLFAVSGAIFLVFYFCLPETYHPVLLKRKAERLRRETGDPRYWARHEREDFGLKAIVGKVLARPLLMLFTEPIVFLLATYMAVTFGTIYVFFTLYPSVFVEIWHFSQGVSTLPFLGLGLGSIAGCLTTGLYDAGYERAVAANGGKPVPEERLRGLFVGGPVLASGLFMFGAGAMFRGLFGFWLPLVAPDIINKLGVENTSYLLGSIILLLCPIPFVFFKYGMRIRGQSRFAPHQ